MVKKPIQFLILEKNKGLTTTKAFVPLGLTNTVFHRSVRCSAFVGCHNSTEQQNKFLSLVSPFGSRRRGATN